MDPLAPLGFPALAGDLARLESALKASVEVADPFLTDVATHLIGAGGKRLRPVLTLCSGYTRSGPDRAASDELVTGGIAVELVHLGSLYHDDVIDEAETRRGVDTVNARWTNTVAILAGDKVPRQPGARLLLRDGIPVATLVAGEFTPLVELPPADEHAARIALLRDPGAHAVAPSAPGSRPMADPLGLHR